MVASVPEAVPVAITTGVGDPLGVRVGPAPQLATHDDLAAGVHPTVDVDVDADRYVRVVSSTADTPILRSGSSTPRSRHPPSSSNRGGWRRRAAVTSPKIADVGVDLVPDRPQ